MSKQDKLIEQALKVLTESDLDELVYDLKSDEASDINNSGLVSQLQYIQGCGALSSVDYIIKEKLKGS